MRATIILALLGLPIAHLGAEPVSVTSDPVGFNIVPCLPNSDTIVGVPFRQMGSFQATLDSNPQAIDDEATLPLRGPFDLTENELANTHYVKFTSGPLDGRWFTITGNDEDTLTIDLNGDSLSTTAEGDSLLVAKFWTLDSLFPPDQATTSWTESPEGSGNFVPNGHAIVASQGTGLRFRRTSLILPNSSGEGINLSPLISDVHFIANGEWHSASGSSATGQTILSPDSSLTIRQPSSVPNTTNFRSSGEVITSGSAIPLFTQDATGQDNFVAPPWPIDIRLDALNLAGTPAFESSGGTSLRNRRDQLVVYDNLIPSLNRPPAAVFYHDGTNWRNSLNNDAISDSTSIPAGYGMMIRKFRSPGGTTAFWYFLPNY